MTAWTPSTKTKEEADNATPKQSYLEISCKIKHKDFCIFGSESSYSTLYVPFCADWQPGKRYVYTLIFGGGYDACARQSCSLSISKLKLIRGKMQMQQKSTSTNNPIILKTIPGRSIISLPGIVFLLSLSHFAWRYELNEFAKTFIILFILPQSSNHS